MKLPTAGSLSTSVSPLVLSASGQGGGSGSPHSVVIGASGLYASIKSAQGETGKNGEQGSESGGFLPAKKGGEGQDSPKPPPVLPDNLPEAILTRIKLFEEVSALST